MATDAYFDDWYAVGGPVGISYTKPTIIVYTGAEQSEDCKCQSGTAIGMALDADDRVYISRLQSVLILHR